MEIGPYFQLIHRTILARIDLLLIQITVRDRVTSRKNIRGSRDVKHPISKNRSPDERLEEHEQWCDYRRIFLASRLARALVYRASPANPPVL